MCLIESADDWTWTNLGSTIVRSAVKEHRCGECCRVIRVGESYERAKGVGEGSLYTFKTCAHCLAARQWLLVMCNGWLFESVLEDLEEHWVEQWQVRSWWLGRVVVRMKRRWTRRDGTLMPVPGPCPREWAKGLLEKGKAA